MKKRTAFIGVILFVLSFSLLKDRLIPSPYIDQNYLAQYRPIPGIKYKRNRWYNKGLKKFQNGDYQSSIDIFSKYITKYSSIEDYAANVYYMLAFSKSKIGDHTGAIADYTKAIEMDYEYGAYAYLNRGVSKGILGDIKGACFDARESVSLGYEREDIKYWIKKNCRSLTK
jgi:tetratricopeptide (TPR) repeat protein